MGDRDALTSSILEFGEALINEHVIRYHGEQEKIPAANYPMGDPFREDRAVGQFKPGYKLEAGCKVICEQRLEPEILTATVLAIDGGICFLRYADGVHGCYPSSALTVTAPATPEVGDTVKSAGATGIILGEEHNSDGVWRVVTDTDTPRLWCRNKFTITCKAKGGDCVC